MYQLHGFSQSGNTYKVALLLQALKQPWTPVHVSFEAFAGGVTRSPDWRQQQNEMGEVPILEFEGHKWSQSAAIMVQLAERHGAHVIGLADIASRPSPLYPLTEADLGLSQWPKEADTPRAALQVFAKRYSERRRELVPGLLSARLSAGGGTAGAEERDMSHHALLVQLAWVVK